MELNDDVYETASDNDIYLNSEDNIDPRFNSSNYVHNSQHYENNIDSNVDNLYIPNNYNQKLTDDEITAKKFDLNNQVYFSPNNQSINESYNSQNHNNEASFPINYNKSCINSYGYNISSSLSSMDNELELTPPITKPQCVEIKVNIIKRSEDKQSNIDFISNKPIVDAKVTDTFEVIKAVLVPDSTTINTVKKSINIPIFFENGQSVVSNKTNTSINDCPNTRERMPTPEPDYDSEMDHMPSDYQQTIKTNNELNNALMIKKLPNNFPNEHTEAPLSSDICDNAFNNLSQIDNHHDLNHDSNRTNEPDVNDDNVDRSLNVVGQSSLVRQPSIRLNRRESAERRKRSGSRENMSSGSQPNTSFTAQLAQLISSSSANNRQNPNNKRVSLPSHLITGNRSDSQLLSLASNSKEIKKNEGEAGKNYIPSGHRPGEKVKRSKTKPGTGSKSRMELLSKPGRPAPDRPSNQIPSKISDAWINYLEQQYEKIDVVLKREETGFGLSLNNEQPVIVSTVKENGIAARNNVSLNDIVFKVNGKMVLKQTHKEVIELIKATGHYLSLTLLRPTNNATTINSLKEFADFVSQPSPVASEKASELKEYALVTAKSMYERACIEYEELKQSYNLTHNDAIYTQLENQAKVVQRLEEVISQKQGYQIPSKVSLNRNPSTASDETGRSNKHSLNPAFMDSSGEIMSIDSSEFNSDEENKSLEYKEFIDINLLLKSPAHLAVFLKFLLIEQEQDAASVFFLIISQSYVIMSGKESQFTVRWAQEIFTTFLAPKAPLQLHYISYETVCQIESIVNSSKETEVRNAFNPVLEEVKDNVCKQMSKIRERRTLGLGNLYGEQFLGQLKNPNSTEAVVLSYQILRESFSKYIDELYITEPKTVNNVKQATLFCLITFMRQFGFGNNISDGLFKKQSSGLNDELASFDGIPYYLCKDKKALKNRMKSKTVRGHPLNAQSLQQMMLPYCIHCQQVIWSIGFQVYQCANCTITLHKQCSDSVRELCAGTIKKIKDPTNPLRRITGFKSLREVRDETTNSKFYPMDDSNSKYNTLPGHNRLFNDFDSLSLQSPGLQSAPIGSPGFPSLISYPTMMGGTNGDLSDSDFEVEPELPTLSSVIPPDVLSQLSPRDRKRQEIINELIYTERTHVRTLKIMMRVFLQPMRRSSAIHQDLVQHLFPNLENIINIHKNLSNDFKKRKQEQNLVLEIGDILVNRLTSEAGDLMETECSRFCQDQPYTLELLRQHQKNDPVFNTFIQNAAMDPLCRKQQLKDFLPKVMQRLTKYPLLIEILFKNTPEGTDEKTNLQKALHRIRDMLLHINMVVRDCENDRKTQAMISRLDISPIENISHPILVELLYNKKLDLTKHKLVYDGDLTWYPRESRGIPIHLALFEDILIIMRREENNHLVLRCPNEIFKSRYIQFPIVKLTYLMTKDLPRDTRAFYLVNASKDDSQMYKLCASSREERNRWTKYIRDAVEAYTNQFKNQAAKPITPPQISDLPDFPFENKEESKDELETPQADEKNFEDENEPPEYLPSSIEDELKRQIVATYELMIEKAIMLSDIHHAAPIQFPILTLAQSGDEFVSQTEECIDFMGDFFLKLTKNINEESDSEWDPINSLVSLSESCQNLLQQLVDIPKNQ